MTHFQSIQPLRQPPGHALPLADNCLSSRVEAGLRIVPKTLRFIANVEAMLMEELAPRSVRCLVQRHRVVVVLDMPTLAGLGDAQARRLRTRIATHEHAPKAVLVRLEAAP